MKTVIIIGASHAAPDAISTLRRAGWDGKIILIGDEAHLPYQRPPLSKAYYSDEVNRDKLEIRNAAFYEKNDVQLKLGQRVTSIDRTGQTVMLENGDALEYDKLILATGTRARQLKVPGADLPQISYLRTLDDVDAIKQKLQNKSSSEQPAKLLIIGAGYIGLEVAASAVKQGVQVTVLEAMDRVLARVTGPEVSTFYQGLHAQNGIDIRLNSALSEFVGDQNSAYALLEGGEKISFDCVVVGIGVLPNSELAEQAGLECDNGIIVDEYTRTNDHNIYAIGDVSNHPNFIYNQRIRLESVPNAAGQAKVAASHICGKDIKYDQLPWFWSDQYDIKLQTAGLFQGYDQTQIQGDIEQGKFSVTYYKQGKVIAIDALNSPKDFMLAKKAILQG